MSQAEPEASTDQQALEKKIEHVLSEIRVVLPGAQALLGFQFIAILMDAFDRLPDWLKQVHLASLLLMTVSVILLVAPPAYHRIVDLGEPTERFHRYAGGMLLASMVPLALGLTGDLFIVVMKVSRSEPLAWGLAGGALLFFSGLWFGATLYQRSQGGGRPTPLSRRATG